MAANARNGGRSELASKSDEGELDAQAPGNDAFAGVLTDDDIALLRSIQPVIGEVDRSRFAAAELLVDDETLAAIKTFRPVFEGMSVDVGPAIKAIPMAIRLETLERHLAEAQVLVHRRLVVTSEPVAEISSGVHRVIQGSPEGSRIRQAFSRFERAWQELFGKGGRPAGKSTPTDPNAPPK